MKQLWNCGITEYIHDMWNILDFTTNTLYIATITLRVIAYTKVRILTVSNSLQDFARNYEGQAVYLSFTQINLTAEDLTNSLSHGLKLHDSQLLKQRTRIHFL